MDAATSRIVADVLAVKIGGYKAIGYKDRGASALVFEATGSTGKVALKVFDPAFLEKYGKGVQTERINRQLLLKGKHHDNLVDILDGGLCPTTEYHFIVMPFLDVPSLDKLVAMIPRERIRPIISQVAAAAEFLEKQNLFHRDIKPPNIAVSPGYEKATLLDLGVVLPLGLAELTDTTDTRPFIGTTQYSPPEFLLRDEDDSREGWRAVTFYQLGGVLHDLLMRRRLFHDRMSPYPRLVRAVMLESPVIDCLDAPPDLVRLARACLSKDPAQRLRLVTWDSFHATPSAERSIDDFKSKIARLRGAKIANRDVVDDAALRNVAAETAKHLALHLKQSCVDDSDTFPPSTQFDLDAHASFALSFAPSTRHGLELYLHCGYQVKAIQAQPETVEISFAAGVSSDRANSLTAIPFHLLFAGEYNSAAHEASLRALYAAFAAALDEPVPARAADVLHAAVTWLKPEVGPDDRSLVA